jgi:hypothetical protein
MLDRFRGIAAIVELAAARPRREGSIADHSSVAPRPFFQPSETLLAFNCVDCKASPAFGIARIDNSAT